MRDSDTLTDAGQAGSPHDPLPQATIKSVNKISPLSETEPLGIMEAWFSLSFMEVGEALGTSHHSFVLMRWTNMIDNQKHSQRGALSCIQLYLDHKHWGNLMYWTLTLQEVPGIRRYQQTPIQNFHIYSTYLRPSSYASPKKKETKTPSLQQNSCFRTVQRKSFKRNWRRSAFLGFERSPAGILIWLQVSCRIWTTNHTLRSNHIKIYWIFKIISFFGDVTSKHTIIEWICVHVSEPFSMRLAGCQYTFHCLMESDMS